MGRLNPLNVYFLLLCSLLVSLPCVEEASHVCNANSDSPYSCASRDGSQDELTSNNLKYISDEDGGRSWRDIDTAGFVRIVRDAYQGESDRLIVDVREPEELEVSGIIPGAISIPRTLK